MPNIIKKLQLCCFKKLRLLLAYSYWPLELVCLHKGLQFKHSIKNACFLVWADWVFLCWGGRSFPRLLYKKHRILMPRIFLFSGWTYFLLIRQVSTCANQSITSLAIGVLKTMVMQKFPLLWFYVCKNEATLSFI